VRSISIATRLEFGLPPTGTAPRLARGSHPIRVIGPGERGGQCRLQGSQGRPRAGRGVGQGRWFSEWIGNRIGWIVTIQCGFT
jgi:hypothetical protein